MKTRLRLGSEAEALALYSVDQRPKCVAEQAEVFTSEKAPTLVVFAEAYGEAVAVKWLLIQLHDLCMRMGWWDTVTADEQRRLTERLGRVAASVMRSYGWMKLTELMYFLNEMEAGKLGQLFMLRNVEKVTDCLKAFVPSLLELRSHHYEAETQRKRLAEAEDRARTAVTRDEWLIGELLAGRKPEMLYNRLLVSEADCERILVEARRRVPSDEELIGELLAGRKPEMLCNRLLVSEADCERILVEARRRVPSDEELIGELLAGRKPSMLYNRLLVSEADCERILVEARRRWFRLQGEENPTWEQLHPRSAGVAPRADGADGADKND